MKIFKKKFVRLEAPGRAPVFDASQKWYGVNSLDLPSRLGYN